MTAGRHVAAPAGRPPGGRWRRWRRGRPFTAGVLIALGGAEMLVTLRAPLGVLLHVGPQGLAAYLVPAILLLCGVLLIATPQQRVFYALLSLVLGLASWLTSNLGGFLVGMLLTLVGGALAFAWTPAKQRRHPDTASAPAPAAPPAPRAPEEEDVGTALLPGAEQPDRTAADRG
ncbi:DUF6114 domain-containing protein [Micromonospora eburnea]|uniref:Integral membrane protein n=1 Tax=Micromonospora eburnea TaxID=227316 RepID=A0A1C6V303_9ACTN|nr:DUF6114 domain-containing protein [Micromonospora eburnea]SCL60731.1 hypothetical protein GA0070604_4362 [Micromonospora eburnea]